MSRHLEKRPYVAGDMALVFDAEAWNAAGGDQGDNEQFWHPCTLRHVYRKGAERVASVEWPDGRVTTGHIVSMMRDPAHRG